MSDFADFTFRHRVADSMSDYTLPAMELYLMHGIHPGSFLMAVLRNDLADAALRADHTNSPILGNIVRWVLYNAPVDSWGDDRRVNAWLNDNDGIRTAYANKCEKAYAWHQLQKQPA